MTFRRFAFNNVMRSKRTYAAYFLSSAFAVMVFFVYAVFAFHPGIAEGDIGSSVTQGLLFSEGLIYAFSFFFVLYSMSAFLKTRKKEFGLLMMLGMTGGQLKRLVFIENVLIGLFATAGGIGMGLVLAKLILLAASRLLELDQSLPFYWPVKAILLTFAAFTLLFLSISLFTVVLLRSSRLIELLKSGTKPKPEPKSSVLLSVFAVLLLGGGYGAALAVKGLAVVVAMVPVSLAVIVGTYFLFTQLSVRIIRGLQRNKRLFWRGTNMMLLSDLAYRMKDNARSFFIVAILSTVAFSAVGSLVGFRAMLTNALISENPFAFEYTAYGEDDGQEQIAIIEQTLSEHGIAYQRYVAELRRVEADGFPHGTPIVKLSAYNSLAAAAGDEPIAVGEGEAYAIYYNNELMPARDREEKLILTGAGLELPVAGHAESYTLPSHSVSYVVADALFDTLEGDPGKRELFYVYDVENWRETKEAGKELREQVSGHFFPLAYRLHETNQGYGVVLFIGFFIGAVFFVAAGSFLYFRLYADMDEDKRKFGAIAKLGLTDGEMSRVVTGQLIVLFFVPIGAALVHGAVALSALQRMFGYSIVVESAAVLSTFFLIQCAYFAFIRIGYMRQLRMR